MKKNIFKRVFSAILAVIMVLLIIPFSMFTAVAETQTFSEQKLDYTPFLIESENENAAYNQQTADMSYNFYIKAREYIDNYGGNNLYSAQEGTFSFDFNGSTFAPSSVYFCKPQQYPSCGVLTGILNFEVGNTTKHIVLVAFRGSDKLEDWITNANVFAGEDGYHNGFEGAAKKHYNAMIDSVSYDLGNGQTISFAGFLSRMQEKDDNYTMIVTGHSLGASVAGIFTSKYLGEKNQITADNVVAYTFASPLTCVDEIKTSTNSKNVFNIINTDDIVTKIGVNIGGEGCARTGYDFKYNLNKYPVVADTITFDFDNHHMGTAYAPTKDYINSHINKFTDNFVLYTNYNEATNTYQRVVYNCGKLIVKGTGKLLGDWSQNTNIDWEKISNECNSLTFAPDCTITEIGDYAFAGMSQLKKLSLPASLEKIGDYAFFRCGFNEALTIGESALPKLKSVGAYAFYGNDFSKIDLSNLDLNNFYWGINAFKGNSKSDALILPSDVTLTQIVSEFGFAYYYEKDNHIEKVTVNTGRTNAPEFTDESYKVESGSKIYCRILDESKLDSDMFEFVFLITVKDTTVVGDPNTYYSNYKDLIKVDSSTGVVEISDLCPTMNFTVSAYYKNKDGSANHNYVYYYIDFEVISGNSDFAGGQGTKDRPYLIATPNQLKLIANQPDKYYKLIADVDFGGETISPLGKLTGGLDGNGYSVYGFNMSANSNIGLFAEVAEGAYVKNLTVGEFSDTTDFLVRISSDSTGQLEIVSGGICAINYGTIENCAVKQIDIYAGVNLDRKEKSALISIAGGISGRNYGNIKNCVVEKSQVRASSSTAKDTKPAKSYAYSGGIVGINHGTISDCSSLINYIKGYTYSKDNNVIFTDWDEGEAQTYCAGLVAKNQGTVNGCYIFENTFFAEAHGDGGEGSDVSKAENYFAISNGTETDYATGNVSSVLTISSIEITQLPVKTHYYIGESFNLYGLEVKNNNGKVVNGYTVSGFDSNKSGTQTITVTYYTGYGTSVEDTFNVTVENVAPQTVVVRPKPARYNINDTLGLENFEATIYYNNGNVEVIDLAKNDSSVVKFNDLVYSLNSIDANILEITYNYAYVTADGKAEISESIVVSTAVDVKCNCSSVQTVNAVVPSTTRYGYTGDIVCTICQAVLEEGKLIEMLEDDTYVPGDINGDGSVNDADVDSLMKYLAGWGVEVEHLALDVNGDGAVNTKDTTHLMRYIAGWDVEIH